MGESRFSLGKERGKKEKKGKKETVGGWKPDEGRDTGGRPQGCDGGTKGRCRLVGVTMTTSWSKSNR
ncbi:hypothetical protein E3N88_30468 [Mikania micrantha]|uniref:Uncharacterized protein n=1 Tax=Mikania micrantha TaxID=192012 RepID=A0A5N6MPP5_9ASTR|nr:hypothetical protein E3N88_30468 [Mikania micrantha]